MSDVDPSAHAKRLAAAAAAEGKGLFRDMADATATGRAIAPGTADGNETLIWLAGNRMPDRRKAVQPPTGKASARADKSLSQPRPNDPIEAAQMRATILADLHHNAPRDPRVRTVFEADPVVAEDATNGNLVTQSMLTARCDVFDAVLTMLGRPILTRSVRARMGAALKSAYGVLDEDAQVEWALSEVRLEESKLFLGRRKQSDLNALGKQLAMIHERSDLWATARAFAMAAHIGVGDAQGSAALADLLEIRDLNDL